MREILQIQNEKEVLSLITNVSYSNVSCWYDASRRDLHMDLIVPKNRLGHAPWPVILWICGGAFRVMNRAVWLPEMMHYAEKGYVIASVEYRTSNEAVFPAALIDTKTAIRFLRVHAEEFCIDPDHIIAMGESAGGTIACLLGVSSDRKEWDQGAYPEQSSSVCAVVDYYGLTDLTKSFDHFEGNDIIPPWLLEEALGVRYSKETAAAASAVTQVTESAPPHLILHGTADSTVDPVQSAEYYERLIRCGVYAELLEIEGAEHGDPLIYQEPVKDRVLEFLDKVLHNRD